MKKYLACFFLSVIAQQVFAQQPTISSFSPVSGPGGTMVTITGTNFSTTPADNIVYFGPVKSTVSIATANSLTVTVPAGATFDPITVTSNNLTAYSSRPFIVTFPGGGAFTANSFASRTDHTAGTEAFSLCTSDFDGDGKPDLAIANRAANSMSVLRNTSVVHAISINPKIDFTTGTTPHHIVAGDIDGDGKHDLVVVNRNSNTISIFRNTSTAGSISFAPKVDVAAGIAPQQVAIGDIDGDGKSDLTFPNGTTTFSVLKNTSVPGTISFATKLDFATGVNGNGISIGDLNADGKPDVILVNVFANSMSVFGNTSASGTISFAARIDYTTGFGPQNVRIGDVDADASPDLIVGSNQTIQAYRNTGSAGVISFAAGLTLMPTGGHQVCLSDLNGDGLPDIGSNRATFDIFSVLRNTGSPGSISFLHEGNFTTGIAPTDMIAVDIDGDTKPDLVTANFAPGNVSIKRNKINEPNISSFTPVGGCSVAGSFVTISGTNFTGTTAVSFGGIPATGFTVISATEISAQVAGTISGTVSVTTPAGTGILEYPPPTISSFTPSAASPGATITITGTYLCGTTGVTIAGIPAASFIVNSDQSISAVVGGTATGNVVVTTPYGTASLAGFNNGPLITSFTPESGATGTTVTITGNNFNTTPVDNIVFFGATQATVTSSSSTSLTVNVPPGATHQPITVTTNNLTGYSNHSFLPTFTGTDPLSSTSLIPKVDFGTGNTPARVWISDIDGDGKSDLVITNNGAHTVSVLRNTSISGSITSGSFAPKLDFPTSTNPGNFAVGDLNGDGKPDLAVISIFNEVVEIFRNTSTAGAVSFAPRTTHPANSDPTGIAIGDLDNDGKADLAIASDSSASINVLRNTGSAGSISFTPANSLSIGDISSDVWIGDLNEDGKAEIAAIATTLAKVFVFRNTGTPGIMSFSRVDFATGNFPHDISSGDLDGDGKPDLAISNNSSNTVSLLRNTSAGGGAISFAPKLDLITALNPHGSCIADFDGDNKPDVAVANSGSDAISFYRNASTIGAFSFSPKIDYVTGDFPNSIAAGDLDGDGKADVAVTNNLSNSVSAFRNRNSEPHRMQLCAGGSTIINSPITGASYQWQVNTGSGFTNITNSGNYSGANTVSLQLTNIPSAWYGYEYRCVVNGVNSIIFSLKFENIWTGAANSAWENPLNWSCGIVPDENTDVIILNGIVVVNSNTTIRSLTLGIGSSFTVNTGFTLTITH
jgi:hypothetical protein